MKLISWNVNGIRAVYKKGFMDWFRSENADIVCLQETKASAEQVPAEIAEIPGYSSYFTLGERPGYSGVAIISKKQPNTVISTLGISACDGEGRIIQAVYDDFVLLNVYFPNGKASPERLSYKMKFYDAFLKHIIALEKKGMQVIFCGDVNTAHTEIDLARPRENVDTSGFLPEERAWIDRVIAAGFSDTFRLFTQDGGHYSWWDLKTGARARDIGWRIDYFFGSKKLKSKVTHAWILKDVMGSDHCPIGINLQL